MPRRTHQIPPAAHADRASGCGSLSLTCSADQDPGGMYLTEEEGKRSVRSAPYGDGLRLLVVAGEDNDSTDTVPLVGRLKGRRCAVRRDADGTARAVSARGLAGKPQ